MTSLLAFWLSAGVLTTAAVAVLLAALLRRPREESPRADYDLGIYRDQLAELDRDMDRGVLSVDQAAAARTEIERRMLLAAEAPAAVEPAASRRGGIATAVGLAVALPASALALYLTLGSPGTESQPFAGRELAPGEDPALSAALIEQISDRIAEDPHDIEAWLLLARLHRATERYGEAAEAYRQVASLSPGNPEAMSSLGEMLVAAGGRSRRSPRPLLRRFGIGPGRSDERRAGDLARPLGRLTGGRPLGAPRLAPDRAGGARTGGGCGRSSSRRALGPQRLGCRGGPGDERG
jgi:cytochrome c-type biogenesis protein CcmH